MFKAFVKSVGIYPTGSLVRKRTPRRGHGAARKLLADPEGQVFFSAKSKMPIQQQIIDLAKLVGREDYRPRIPGRLELPEPEELVRVAHCARARIFD